MKNITEDEFDEKFKTVSPRESAVEKGERTLVTTLTKRMADLNKAIDSLGSQISETQRKLAASEGDRAQLMAQPQSGSLFGMAVEPGLYLAEALFNDA